jgi:hypothetical protein
MHPHAHAGVRRASGSGPQPRVCPPVVQVQVQRLSSILPDSAAGEWMLGPMFTLKPTPGSGTFSAADRSRLLATATLPAPRRRPNRWQPPPRAG